MRGRTKKLLIGVFLLIGLGLCITGIFLPAAIAIALITAGGTSLGAAVVVTRMLFTKGYDTPPDSVQMDVSRTQTAHMAPRQSSIVVIPTSIDIDKKVEVKIEAKEKVKP